MHKKEVSRTGMHLRQFAISVCLVAAIAALIAYGKKASTHVQSYEIPISDFQSALAKGFEGPKLSNKIDVKSVAVEPEGDKLKVRMDLTAALLESPVALTVEVIGKPGYGAIRKQFTFTSEKLTFVKKDFLTGTGATKKDVRFDREREIESAIRGAVDTLFSRVHAHDIEPLAGQVWLNSAKVVGDKVVVEYSFLQSQQTFLIVCLIIALLILVGIVMYTMPEIFFFWLIFS